MDPLCQEFVEAINELGLEAKSIDCEQSSLIYDRVRNVFVIGNPRSWWMNLVFKPLIYQTRDEVLTALSKDIFENVLLILESDSSACVFEVMLQDAFRLLDACQFCEYYIVSKDFSWLIIESDHNQFYLCKSGSGERGAVDV